MMDALDKEGQGREGKEEFEEKKKKKKRNWRKEGDAVLHRDSPRRRAHILQVILIQN